DLLRATDLGLHATQQPPATRVHVEALEHAGAEQPVRRPSVRGLPGHRRDDDELVRGRAIEELPAAVRPHRLDATVGRQLELLLLLQVSKLDARGPRT